MPDPKDNAKATGDVHPPEVETLDVRPRGRPVSQGGAEGGMPDSGMSRDLEGAGKSGKSVNEAGVLKDKDAPGFERKGG